MQGASCNAQQPLLADHGDLYRRWPIGHTAVTFHQDLGGYCPMSRVHNVARCSTGVVSWGHAPGTEHGGNSNPDGRDDSCCPRPTRHQQGGSGPASGGEPTDLARDRGRATHRVDARDALSDRPGARLSRRHVVRHDDTQLACAHRGTTAPGDGAGAADVVRRAGRIRRQPRSGHVAPTARRPRCRHSVDA